MRIFKIQSQKTKLFSSGGSWPSFTKRGKIWKMKGHLSNHLAQLDGHGRAIYRQEGAEIVEFEVSETPVAYQSIEEALKKREEATILKHQKAKKKVEDWAKEQRRKEYQRLKKEFENP